MRRSYVIYGGEEKLMDREEKIDELIEKMKDVIQLAKEVGWGKYELAVSIACSWDYYLGFDA